MDQGQGISVTPQELQALVRRQAEHIGNLQTTKFLLEEKLAAAQQENLLLKTALEGAEKKEAS